MSDASLISFDYAIKFLLRNKGDYDIIEGFLSALFKAFGYKAVKIKALLESESNKEEISLKKSVADLIVEDTDGQKYIVEIDRAFSAHFMHKACFNTSRLIVDTIKTSENYASIQKVFHINLMYADIPEMQGPIYHGKTEFHCNEGSHKLKIQLKDRETQHSVTLPNVFPEYFLICIPKFDDQIRKEVDEWLYVMKHETVKQEFSSPTMSKLSERLSRLKMTAEELDAYYRYMQSALKQRDYYVTGFEEGKQEGLEEGEKKGIEKGMEKGIEKGVEKGKMEIAKTLLEKGMDIANIQEITGLSLAQVEELKNKWII